ncbi:MAG: 4Fe-4S dicluster domain-containing protein [Candidatus Omnitrophica bacterium]|nr:4Fe-4S dicluster domain-containing protein [Candidatus Omnitrophota bacterium]MCM8791440.1 4Fe-4S dicluster domain-containing protein [Candidatus Omnitrophota bacterium]
MAKIRIDKQRCKGCYLCVVNCPNNLIKIAKDLNSKGVKSVYFSGGKCTGCAMCALVCPECIIEVYR